MDNTWQVESAIQAKANREYQKVLVEFLYQLADDDYIFSYRGSEWLGLAPHIEADVAFSSITQDTMGHAVMYYSMLEELGEKDVDELAHLRSPEQFRNSVLLERVNGTGDYKETPRYDWAYAVIRSFFYHTFKRFRLESLLSCSYQPLAQMANKMLREHYYHLLHWEGWMKQLTGTIDAITHMEQAIAKAWPDVAGLFSLGKMEEQIVISRLSISTEDMRSKWFVTVGGKLENYNVTMPKNLEPIELDGRKGQHTPALKSALDTLSEVYRLDPTANW